MALEGTIKEFGVADIIQLIAQQQKTGVLIVENGGLAAEICFADGRLTETRVSHKMTRSPLGEMLFKAKQISAEDLRRLLDKQKDTFEYLGEIILREGLVNAHVLERAIQTQIYETFYDILQWRDGRYRFVPDKVTAASSMIAIPSLETILLDVFRMIDEWPEIHGVIPSFAIVLERAAAHMPEHLSADMQLVITLIDGTRTVGHIIDEALLGRFATCKMLADLIKHGLVRPAAASVVHRWNTWGAAKRTAGAAAAYVGLMALGAAFYALPSRLPASLVPAASSGRLQQSYLMRSLQHISMLQLERAIQAFHTVYGHYPEDLSRLGQAGVLDNAIVQRYVDAGVVYAAAAGSFILQAGP